jgi:hypothetical protein
MDDHQFSYIPPIKLKREKKNTTDACKQKHVVDVVGKVVLITRGHMELS